MSKNSNSIGQIIHRTNHPPDKSSKWVGIAVSLLGLWDSLLAIPACVPNTSWAQNPLMLGRPLYPQGIFLQGCKHSSGMNPDVLETRWKRAAKKGTKGRKFLHVGNAALPCLPCLPVSFLRLLPLSALPQSRTWLLGVTCGSGPSRPASALGRLHWKGCFGL